MYRIPFHDKITSTVCLPSDSRLTRNTLDHEIADNVDLVEETTLIAVGLVALELAVVFIILVAKCFHEIRSKIDKPAMPTRSTVRFPEHRATVYEANIEDIRL